MNSTILQIKFRKNLLYLQMLNAAFLLLLKGTNMDDGIAIIFIHVIGLLSMTYFVGSLRWFYQFNRLILGIFTSTFLYFTAFGCVETILHYYNIHVICSDPQGNLLPLILAISIVFAMLAWLFKAIYMIINKHWFTSMPKAK